MKERVVWSTWDGKAVLTEESDARRVLFVGDSKDPEVRPQVWNRTEWGEPFDPANEASILAEWGLFEYGRAKEMSGGKKGGVFEVANARSSHIVTLHAVDDEAIEQEWAWGKLGHPGGMRGRGDPRSPRVRIVPVEYEEQMDREIARLRLVFKGVAETLAKNGACLLRSSPMKAQELNDILRSIDEVFRIAATEAEPMPVYSAAPPGSVVAVDLVKEPDETGVTVLSVELAGPTRAEFAAAVDEAFGWVCELEESVKKGFRSSAWDEVGKLKVALSSVGAGSPRAPELGKDPEATRFIVEVSRALSGDALEVVRLRRVIRDIEQKLSAGMAEATSWAGVVAVIDDADRTGEVPHAVRVIGYALEDLPREPRG